MTNKMKRVIADCEIKMAGGNSREFTAYGNVKHVMDKARDVAVDGCYKYERMPRLFWSHDPFAPPLGPIKSVEEDSKGLLFTGMLSKTPRGDEIYTLAKDNAIDQFSMGYSVLDERFNATENINYLHHVDVKEISFVNFACNEHSRLVDIKAEIGRGELPTKRELQNILRESGLSKREAEQIANKYNPVVEDELDLKSLSNMRLFN